MSDAMDIVLGHDATPIARVGDHAIPAMLPHEIENVRQLEAVLLGMPQVSIITGHILHGGMYARTVKIPEGVIITGVLVKVPTILIVQGSALVYIGAAELDLAGYNVVPAAAGRKQAFIAKSDVYLTMILPSEAVDVGTAESDFTDETYLLVSHKDPELNHTIITGEPRGRN